MKKLNLRKFKRYLINNPASIWKLFEIKKLFPYTMLPYPALHQMYKIIEEVNRRNIPGSIVEMGCWKGGCGAFMAKYAGDRKTWLFDSFEGLPEVSEYDQHQAEIKNLNFKEGQEIKTTGAMVASENDVYSILNILKAKANVVKGWFQDTLPKHKKEIGNIAILRLDGDIYESTKYCLEELYDQVSVGGYVVIDDYYNWDGCRWAVYKFFYNRKINPVIVSQMREGRAYFIKK
jgi:hypothetical protein